MSAPDLTSRLVSCFQTVFPQLSEAEIRNADQERLEAWDSVAGITLLSVIEDEFGIAPDLEQLSELTSFSAVEAWVRQAAQA